MIAQYLAINHPAMVEKLVLAVTLCKPNDIIRSAVQSWLTWAGANDFRRIFIDTAERSYSAKLLAAYRPFYAILSRLNKPKNLDRFIIQANACIGHNAWDEVDKIHCPTLIIGGAEDKLVGAKASHELAEKIHGSELFIYEGLGHAAYEEAKDFNQRVLTFLDGASSQADNVHG